MTPSRTRNSEQIFDGYESAHPVIMSTRSLEDRTAWILCDTCPFMRDDDDDFVHGELMTFLCENGASLRNDSDEFCKVSFSHSCKDHDSGKGIPNMLINRLVYSPLKMIKRV